MTAPRLPEGVRLSELPGGTRVATERMPAVRSVAVGFWVGSGSRHEGPAVAGASHFLEHLLFKGTERRGAQQIAEEIDRVGGDMNAFTAKEYTCFYVRCLDRDVALAIDVLGDMVTSSRITADDVDAERSVVLEEIRSHLDTPDDLVHSEFSKAVFGEHPLGREVLGDKATITGMRRDEVHGYYREQYAPSNLVIAIAGNVDHDEVVDLAAKALEGWDGPAPNGPPDAARPHEARLRHIAASRSIEQAHVILGGPGMRRSDERRHAASVLNQALGGGMASRLFQEVRERRGLAYSVFSYLSMHAEAGSYGVYAGTAPDQVGKVLDAVGAELEHVAEHGLSEEELVRAQGSLTGSMVLALEDTGSRMVRIGKALSTDSPLLGLDELMAAVDAVTDRDIRDVAGEFLAQPRTLALVGPLDDAEVDRLAGHPALGGAVA